MGRAKPYNSFVPLFGDTTRYIKLLPVTTEIVKVQLPVFPLPSRKTKITVVLLPTEKALPDEGLPNRRATDPELSVAVALGKVTATEVVPSSTV